MNKPPQAQMFLLENPTKLLGAKMITISHKLF